MASVVRPPFSGGGYTGRSDTSSNPNPNPQRRKVVIAVVIVVVIVSIIFKIRSNQTHIPFVKEELNYQSAFEKLNQFSSNSTPVNEQIIIVNGADFLKLFKANLSKSECEFSRQICVSDGSVEFSISCGSSELTFSTDDIFSISVKSDYGSQSYRLVDIFDTHPSSEDCALIEHFNKDTILDNETFLKAVDCYFSNHIPEQGCKAQFCFEFRESTNANLSENCEGINISASSSGSLTLSAITNDGEKVELKISGDE